MPQPSPGAKRLLVAEDSPENRMLLEVSLAPPQFHVTMVENGEQAVSRFQAEPFDLVLMDMQMPVMDGYAATLAIRRWEDASGRVRTPIIALTASALTQDTERSLQAGCDLHVSKPFKRAQLLEAIASLASPPDPEEDALEEAFEDALKQLVPAYLAKRAHELAILRDALRRQDFAEMQTIGHRLTGSGASYGLASLSELGRALEAAAQQGNSRTLEALLLELADAIETAQGHL